MFVKKLVEKAPFWKTAAGSSIRGLHSEDVNPHLAFHYGIPSGACTLAPHPTHDLLAIATRNGQIKLFGCDNTQLLLQADEACPSKFLHFVEDQVILFNVNAQNQIEVWNIEARMLCSVHTFDGEITSFNVQKCFVYIGDTVGNVTLMKLDQSQWNLVQMPYIIPFAESYHTLGSNADARNEICVAYILPQPLAEYDRVLIIFKDGLLSLWDIRSSKVVFRCGKSPQPAANEMPKYATSACWVTADGSKVAVGYSSGDLYIWNIPLLPYGGTDKELNSVPNGPLQKHNLGYRLDKVPIVSLRWIGTDKKSGRLYINGFTDDGSHSLQVLVLQGESERTTKVVLPVTEPCVAMEHVTWLGENSRKRQNVLVLLLKSGHICLYDDTEIEQNVQSAQSRSPNALLNKMLVRLPFGDSAINVGSYHTNSSLVTNPHEDYFTIVNKYPLFLSINQKERTRGTLTVSSGEDIHNTRNLYITGHLDGSINFWDASSPMLLLMLTIKPNDDNASTCAPVTALKFDVSSNILVAGDQNGLVRIITFMKGASETMFSFLQAKGDNYTSQCVKLKGAVVSITMKTESRQLAVGTNKGVVSMINMEDATVSYQKQLESRQYSSVISLQFGTYEQDYQKKNALLVAMEDSTILVMNEESGQLLSTSPVQTKNPSRAILMQIIEVAPDVSSAPDGEDTSLKDSLLLLCSEKAVRLFSLSHAVQGVKKVVNKKALSTICCYGSVVYGPSSTIGLVLVFATGRVEIRSLPDLALVKESSVRGLDQLCSQKSSSVCSSSDGEIIMVNGDSEIIFFSILCRNGIYRHVESINMVYRKVDVHQDTSSHRTDTSNKKKGFFGVVLKDPKGSSRTQETEENRCYNVQKSTSEELSLIFSMANFPDLTKRNSGSGKESENVELSIDDIDLGDTASKERGPYFTGFTKQKFTKGLQNLKDKLKPKADEKPTAGKHKQEDERPVNMVDQIKMKYGFQTNDESSALKLTQNKLKENVKKLEAIGARTAEMAGDAQNFSSLTKELLRGMKNDKSSS